MSINAPHTDLFKRSTKEIQFWCRTGEEPKAANQDMKYYLDLQEKRLQKHNLNIEMTFEPEGDVYSSQQVLSAVPVLNSIECFSRFNQSTYFQSGNQTISYYRDSQKIYSKKKFVSLYQAIINPEPGDRHVGGTTYVCPNCGAISTLNTLQEEGCPYCGTRYIMKDLYPKVANYYCLDTTGISKEQTRYHKAIIWGGGAAISLFGTLYSLFTTDDFTIAIGIVSLLLGTLLGAFLMYLGVSLFCLGKVFLQAGKSVGMLTDSAGSKQKITKNLSQYDPSFSYEYFEGKALSLARMMMFHDNLANCVQYKGQGSSSNFADLIDIQYRGRFAVESIQRNQDRIEVVLKLYLTNTIDDGKKISQKDEAIRIWMYHHVQFPVDPTYSIRKVQCPCCGGSFDAREQKTCPFCNQEYDAGINDWVVTKIQR